MSETAIIYADEVVLGDDIQLQHAVEITEAIREQGEATLNAEEGTISFRFEATDLWHACELAHEVAQLLQSRGLEYDVARESLVNDPNPTDADEGKDEIEAPGPEAAAARERVTRPA